MTPYDPKLKEAMKEIDQIMMKYDIGGYINLVSRSHGAYRLYVTPTWSAAKWEGEDCLRIKAVKSEMGEEKAHDLLHGTVHLIYSIDKFCDMGVQFAKSIKQLLLEKVEVIEEPQTITPHRDN